MNALATGEKVAEGGCLCGAVTFSITLPTLFCGHCHCLICRKAHGAGYITWIGVPLTRFELKQGARKLRKYASSAHGKRSFCEECGSTLFCQSDKHPGVMDIVLANIDGKIDRVPGAHFYFSDRADWVLTQDQLPKFGGETGTQAIKNET